LTASAAGVDVAANARRRLHSGGTNWMTSARQSEGPTTLKEGATMSRKQKKTKPAGKARKTPKTTARVVAAPTATKDRDPRLPAPGATLARTYKGKEYRVTVLDAGFRYDGKDWRSLTAIARAVTGYPAISGPAWFGIAERGTGATGRGTKRDAATGATVAATA
jgi:hypothetical protein